uniref:Prolactin n=1 Tax=Denticeps clupeoides TaxID=299321 RepID=A0AAY4CUB7_9TELE
QCTHTAEKGYKLGRRAVLMCAAMCSEAVGVSDLLDRASQISDKLHSLSTSLSNDLDSHFVPVTRLLMPRPSACHTSSLQTPNDKDHALRVPETELLSLVRSLVLAWTDPLALLSSEASALDHPANSIINTKAKELHDQSKTLGEGLEHLVSKMGSSGPSISLLPLFESNDLGQDPTSRLVNFHFLLSCFRRDSHKIDSFLKVLRCRAAPMNPDTC